MHSATAQAEKAQGLAAMLASFNGREGFRQGPKGEAAVGVEPREHVAGFLGADGIVFHFGPSLGQLLSDGIGHPVLVHDGSGRWDCFKGHSFAKDASHVAYSDGLFVTVFGHAAPYT